MVAEIAGWIAPVATMIAAMMTAANLGARVTGWGFALFAVGAVAWCVDALAGAQTNLLATNAFLLVVDLVGVWRWLGRRARYDSGARSARSDSADTRSATLFQVGSLEGRRLTGSDGSTLGRVVGAMAACRDGRIDYLVVSVGGVGGVGERLHAVGYGEVTVDETAVGSHLDSGMLGRRPVLVPDRWPESAEAAGVA